LSSTIRIVAISGERRLFHDRRHAVAAVEHVSRISDRDPDVWRSRYREVLSCTVA